MSRAVLPTALVCVLGFCLPARSADPSPEDDTPATAEALPGTEAPSLRLDEILVTPTRRAEPRLRLPYSVERVAEERLSGPLAPRNLPRAVAEVPGVVVQKTGYGQGSPYIRGLTGFRTLLLVDGIRLNNSVFRDGPNQYTSTVDNLSLRTLLAVRGPASVLYGSDAMGGALNFLPREPEPGEEGYSWGGRIHQRFASAEGSSVSRLELFGGVGSEFGFLGGFDRKIFGDLSAGDGDLDETGYDEWAADVRLVWTPSEEVRLTLAYQRVSQDEVPRTHKTIHSRAWHGTTVGSEVHRDLDQVRDLLYLRAEVAEPFSFMDRVVGTLSWHHHRETRFREKSGGEKDRQGFTLTSIGFALQAESATSLGTLTYGFDAYRDLVDSFSKKFDASGALTSEGIQGPVADDAVYDLVGVYLQEVVALAEDLTLTAGMRGTYASVDADSVLDPESGLETSVRDRFASVVGSLRLAYGGIEGLNLYGGASQGFRAPNLSDLTRLDTARSDEIETPSPGLDPERALTFEVGGRFRLDGVRAEISLYYTSLRDLVQRYPTGEVIDGDSEVAKANVGDGFVRGAELSVEVDLGGGLAAFGSGAYVYGRVDTYPTSDQKEAREYLDRLPPLTGRVGVRYRHECGLGLEGRVTMADKADRLSTRDRSDTQRIPPGGTPGYAVIDLSATYPVTDFAVVTLALENLTDRAYRVHGSGQNEPGRNLSLTLVLRF